MSRRQKELERVAALEADLFSRLMTELESVAQGKHTLFFMTREFNPHGLPDPMLRGRTADLSKLASESLRLCESLGEPNGAPVATVFRRYLARANDLADHHRLGPARLAQELLAELRALGT